MGSTPVRENKILQAAWHGQNRVLILFFFLKDDLYCNDIVASDYIIKYMEGLKRKLDMQLVINNLNFLFSVTSYERKKNTSLLITDYLGSKAL